jgi:hypothetical protein
MKSQKQKSKHKLILAILGNKLTLLKVLYMETFLGEIVGVDDEYYFVCGEKGNHKPKVYIPVGSALFLE